MSRSSRRTSSQRQPKPRLDEYYQRILAEKDYYLSVEVSTHADFNDESARRAIQPMFGRIFIEVQPETIEDRLDETDLEEINIGFIKGWRTVSPSSSEILYWCDSFSGLVTDAFTWLAYQQTEIETDELLLQPILYVERVEVTPAWRGYRLTLPAVAIYLDLVACDFVFLHPGFSIPDPLLSVAEVRTKRLLRHYWQKLGFEHYDAQHNMMWTFNWNCPEWLLPESTKRQA